MLLMAVLTIGASFFMPAFIPFAEWFTLGLFDQVGYSFVVQGRNDKTPEGFKIAESAYHIIGFMMNAAVLGLVFILVKETNSVAVAYYSLIGFILPFWFGLKDVMYYLGLQEKMSDFMYWFYWTPLGICRTTRLMLQGKIQGLIQINHETRQLEEKERQEGMLRFAAAVFLTHKDRVWLTKKEIIIQAVMGLAATIIYLWMYLPQ